MNKEYGDEPEHAIQKRQGFLPSKIARAPGQDDGAGQSNNENLGISATHNRGQHSLSMEEQQNRGQSSLSGKVDGGIFRLM